MSKRSIVAWLRRWIEKIRLALWLNEREFDASRRAVLFGCAAVVAATVLTHVPAAEALTWIPVQGPLSAELSRVVRVAFMPRIHMQLWQQSPLTAMLLRDDA